MTWTLDDIRDARAQLNAMTDQMDAARRGIMRRAPRSELDRVARELGIVNPEYSLKADLIDRIAARIDSEGTT